MFFVRTNDGSQIVAAYILGFIMITFTVIVLCYHIQLISKTKLWRRAKDSLAQTVSEWNADEGKGGIMELTSAQSLLTSTIVDASRRPKLDYNQFREELLD